MRRGLHSEVVDALAAPIAAGRYAAGHVLPTEAALSEELGVSRTVIREAIKVLASKGLIEARPKIGIRVLPERHWNMLDSDVLGWRLLQLAPALSFYRELSEIRLIVEPQGAGLAALRRTDEEAREILRLLELMAASASTVDTAMDYAAADMEFHSAVLHATHNTMLMQMTATINSALAASRRVTVNVPGGPELRMTEHRAVGRAIEARKAHAAARAMETLVRATWADVEIVLGSGPGDEQQSAEVGQVSEEDSGILGISTLRPLASRYIQGRTRHGDVSS